MHVQLATTPPVPFRLNDSQVNYMCFSRPAAEGHGLPPVATLELFLLAICISLAALVSALGDASFPLFCVYARYI